MFIYRLVFPLTHLTVRGFPSVEVGRDLVVQMIRDFHVESKEIVEVGSSGLSVGTKIARRNSIGFRLIPIRHKNVALT